MNEKAKRLLSLYRDNALEIERLENELAKWKSRSQRTECAAVCVLLDLRLSEAAARRAEADKILQAVIDERLHLLLTLHYIDGLSWEQVSQRMGYDLRWVMRLHKRALSCL